MEGEIEQWAAIDENGMDSGSRRIEETIDVEFRVTDPSYPFVDASTVKGCRLDLEVAFPRSADGFVEYFTLTGAPIVRVLDVISEHDGIDASLVARHTDGGRIKFRVHDYCVARTVIEFGTIPRIVEATDGDGRVVAAVSSQSEADALIQRFEREHPTVTVDDCHSEGRSMSLVTHHDFKQHVIRALTDRQREAFLAAYMNGYYDWPRKHEAAELAAKLGISPPTYSQHLRSAEGKLFSLLLGTDDERVFIV